MAEFKLGRIKFVWQGEWTASNSYVVDDVVSNGGQSYLCVKNHTASSLFKTDLDANPTYWNLVAGGTQWTGDWTTNTYYNLGDQVKYGGTVYVCIEAHSSAATTLLGLENDQSKWNAFAQSLSWEQDWTVNTRYRINDFVVYGGYTYVCNTSHVSAATLADGLEFDLSKWDIFNKGLIYLGEWTDAVRYRVNDVVKYGASTWICTAAHTSATILDETKFEIFVEGLQFESTWDAGTNYQIGDIVTYGGYSYVASQTNINQNPLSQTAYWNVYTTGLNFRSDYVGVTAYRIGDVVRLGGYTYLAIADTTGNTPPNATYWVRLNSGLNWTDIPETYTGVSATTITGTGTSATFDVTRQGTVYTVSVNNGGSGYNIGDTLLIDGTDIGGISPANDLNITIDSEAANVATAVTITNGIAVTWTDSTSYILGDVVFFGASSYICVQAHTSAALTNRPDVDTSATYWNLLAAGSESSVLTTDGDTYYYSANGPARLPVGTDGQVLRVKSGYPEWAYYGIINNLVYVAPTGEDSLGNGRGLTIDKPWKTVRYAAEQVEDGYLNRDTKEIVKRNKQFIMKEVSNWVTYTYTVAISASDAASDQFTCDSTANLLVNMPFEFDGTVGGVTAGVTYYIKEIIDATHFTISEVQGGTLFGLTTQTASMNGSLSYDYALCERDTGILIDALLFDISHGGNENSTKAALAYYTSAGADYINSNFGNQVVQTLAAYTYMKTVVEAVIANTAPAANYQTLNSVASPVTQIIDATKITSAETLNEVKALMNVVTDGIAAGNAASIPAAVPATNTISVKTGTYFEVLPIVIPKNTAIVGDELRGTVIRPTPAIPLLANDKPKTISALNRIRDIADDLVQNNAISASSGNTISQVTSLPAGSVGSEVALTRVSDATDTITEVFINGTTARPTEILPTPTSGTNNASDSGFANAVLQIANNYDFIKSDVSNYLNNNYNSIWTGLGAEGQAACQRDVGYILDALRYDLTYGGNTQSLIVGSSYYTYINLVIQEIELPATIAAYTHLKSIIDNIILETGPTPQAGNVVTIDTSAAAGSAGAATYAENRVQDIIDWITNGTAPTAISPDTSWVGSSLLAGNTLLQAKKTEIQNDGLQYVRKFFQELSFNEATCSRDIGYMVDAIGYDTMFGSNFASIVTGMSYHRALTSTQLVLASQKKASIGLIKFLKYKIKGLATGGASATIKSVIDDITGTITGGATPPTLWPAISTTDAEDFAAAKLIYQNKDFAIAEVIQYITDNYPSVAYSQAACSRDVGLIIDALRYDMTYGGNSQSKHAGVAYYSRLTDALQIDANDKAATLAAYGQLKSLVQAISTGGAYTALQGTETRIVGVTGDASSSTRVGSLLDTITSIIDTGLTSGVPQVTVTDITSGTTFTTSAAHGLLVGDEVNPQTTPTTGNGGFGLIAGTIYYVKSVPDSTSFTLAASYNGTEIIDFTDGTGLTLAFETTNLPSLAGVTIGLKTQHTSLSSARTTIRNNVIDYINTNYPNLTYDPVVCSRDIGYVLDAIGYDLMLGSNFRSIKAGMSYYQNQARLAVGDQKRATLDSYRYLRKLIIDTISTNATATASAKSNMNTIIDIIDKGYGETPEVNGTMLYNNDKAYEYAADILTQNINFLKNEATAWISATFGGTVTDTSSIDNTITTSAAHNLSVGDPIVFTGDVPLGGLGTSVIYYVLTTPTATTFTITNEQNGTTEIVPTTDTGTMTVTYSFDATACQRDMSEYVKAIAHDIRWIGNYRGTRAAELYVNAVQGSELSDMFRTRNACGLRNCTLQGLNGQLSAENDFNTKRPTAGAFVALDPGFGPNDQDVWVQTRSHYSQNVTMFGTGCSGAKIDSALHAGGNKSMVKNDFTTIISDGIGVWCTGADSLTELVSVFNYYGYAGYLAELGGRIRATNGNSSYGTYGVIAEGVSSKETPIYGTINNKGAQAQITNTVTDSLRQILRFEFGNAGSNYSNAVHTINGAGYNAAAIADEFRDGAVSETRIIDLNNAEGFGGSNYVTAANAAQSGNTTQITIAATDQAISSAYVGMRIQIVAGTGVGQFANIATYDTGSKIATVTKPSDGTAGWDHVVPGTPIEANLDLTTSYIIEPQISYTSPGYTATARTMATTADWEDVVYADGKYVAVEASGTVSNYSADGITWANAGALTGNFAWKDVVYGGGQGAVASVIVGGLGGEGAVLEAVLGVPNTTGAATENQVASVRVIDGGQGYTTPPTIVFAAVNGGLGATAKCAVLDGKIKDVTVTIPGSGYLVAPTVSAVTDRVTSATVAQWGRGYYSDPQIVVDDPFVADAAWSSGGTVTLDDIIYYNNTTVTPTRKNWYLVTTGGTLTSTGPTHTEGTEANGTAALEYIGTTTVLTPSRVTAAGTIDGLVSLDIEYEGAGYTVIPEVTVTDTSARFVAIATTTGDNCYTTSTAIESATAWTAGTDTGKTDLQALTYGNGVYVAVGGTSSAVSSTNGNTWISRSIVSLGSGTYSDVQYGNNTYVAIATGTNATAISLNGNSWAAGGNMPTSAAWGSIAYGNGRFVAIETGTASTKAAVSYDKGANWIAITLPVSTTWNKIAYGQGLFLAVSNNTVAATSPDGITWTQRALPSSSNWRAVSFGNPNKLPVWSVISGTNGTTAATIRTGAQATGRVAVTSGVVTEVRMIEPGSGYPVGVVTATTETGSVITTNDTTNLVDSQPIEFEGVIAGGLEENVTYYVIGSTIVTNTSFKVSATPGSSTPIDIVDATGLSGTYRAGPIYTLTDPNKVKTANLRIRTSDGAIGNPSFTDRGEDNTTANSETLGDGFANLYQPSTFINVSGLYDAPLPGANVEFASIPGQYFKLVTVTNLLGELGNYSATFQLNPGLTVLNAPSHGDIITTRIAYSQVRLTGHDYLYIGTGNKTQTNYPYVDITNAVQSNQELFSGGGRVFFTSTDQDGNFNVGDLFGVQQATGTATLNASAFNLSGLNSLQLGALELGVDSAIITQFSTDPFFTADSDNIVPTQRAIRAYITAQIGGGQSSLNVNTLTSGIVYIAGNSISTTTGAGINITSRMNFTGGITGTPVALSFFMQR